MVGWGLRGGDREPIRYRRKVFKRCMSVLEVVNLLVSVIALGGAGTAVVLALLRPGWLKEQERRILLLETEWEEVLEKIKKRGDRLSRERGILKKAEEESPTPSPMLNRRAELWAMKRNKEASRAK